MRYDDFSWCVGVVFTFSDSGLVIEAPLIGFVLKLVRAIRETAATGAPVQLNDEEGSYQITVTRDSGSIIVSDSFSGGTAHLPAAALTQEIRREIDRAFAELESAIPSFSNNDGYCTLKKEITEAFADDLLP